MAINLAKTIGKAFAKYGKPIGVRSMTLTKVTTGTRTPLAQSAGTNPTSTSYACKGIVESFTTQIDGTLVKSNDRKISLFASEIASGVTPDVNDKITIDGVAYRIVGGKDGKGVMWDPADVLYVCHARK